MERGENPPTGKQSRFHDSTISRFHEFDFRTPRTGTSPRFLSPTHEAAPGATVVLHCAVRVARGEAGHAGQRARAPRARLVDERLVVSIEGGSPRRRRDEVAVLGPRGSRRHAGALCHARTLAMGEVLVASPSGPTRVDTAPPSIVRTRAGKTQPPMTRARYALDVHGGVFAAVQRRATRVAGNDRRANTCRTPRLFPCCARFATRGANARAPSRCRAKRLCSVTPLTRSSRSPAIPDSGGSRTPLDSLRRARGFPTPDGQHAVHLQEGCARASRESRAQGDHVRPRRWGGRGRSRDCRERGRRAVRQVQEKRACRGRPPARATLESERDVTCEIELPSRRVTDRTVRNPKNDVLFSRNPPPLPPRSASAARITRRCSLSWCS